MSDPYTRIAILEKELEHCQTGKAEAEIALQCFAKLSGKGTAYCGSGSQHVTKLELELAQVLKEKEALEAKLENALAIITTFLTHSSPLDKVSGSNKLQSKPDFVRKGDHSGASQGKGNSTTSSNNTTVVESVRDNLSDGAEAQDRGCNRYQLASQPVEFEDRPYILHFVADEHDGPTCRSPTFKQDSEQPTPDSHGLIHSNVSWDRSSETSIGPNTDASFHEYSTSSDGPTIATSSFVTANAGDDDSNNAPTTTVLEKGDNIHALGVQKWNVAASATSIGDMSALCPVLKFEENIWSRGQSQESSVVKPFKGPSPTAPLWKVRGLFRSPSQRDCAIKLHKREAGSNERIFPDLFKYGVRFQPEQDEDNIYRTVVVQGLSPDTTMHQLLQKVRGGRVVDAKLLETSKLLGTNSALIVFLHEHAAMAYEDYARTETLMINNRYVNVKIVDTPTYPTSIPLKKSMENHHHTRCLEVHNYPHQVSEFQLRVDLGVESHGKDSRVEHLRLSSDGVLELHSSSVYYAGRAFGMFSTFHQYKRCKVYFVSDPCAQPVESLMEDRETILNSTTKQNGPLSARSPTEKVSFPLDNDQKPKHPQFTEFVNNDCDEASSLAINIRVESPDENFGRLQQPEEETEPEHRRGRSFQGEGSKIV